MMVKYDKSVDVIYIRLSEAKVQESDESKPGVVIDYDKDGFVVGIEILEASRRIPEPQKLVYLAA